MSYTLREVAAMLGLSAAQIRSYASKGFLTPERGPRGELRFGFRDLVVLRTAGELSSAKIPPRKVKRALEKLRDQLPPGRSITAVRIAADGERVVVRDGESIWNPESGQSLFDFAVADLAAKTAPFAKKAAESARARANELEADDWYDLACQIELTSIDEARDAYQRALQLDPHHSDAHVNLGRLFHEERELVAAEQHYRAALEIDPQHSIAAFNLGVALEDRGKIEQAIEAYENALMLDPSNADAHYNLAGIYERRGEKASAVQHLKAYARARAEAN